jgi:hypothetical protein
LIGGAGIAAACDADGAALPEIPPRLLARTIATLRDAQAALRARPRAEIVAALGDVVEGWLAANSPWFERAVAALPDATGFSPAMVRHALPTMLAPLRAPALGDLLAAEAQNRHGPALILHVLPGNLPGLAAVPAALSLAIGSSPLLKAGRGDRVFPALFVDSIRERDGALGACLAACYWRGGDRPCEDIALAAADVVVAAGDDQTIDDLRTRARGRLVGHGHRVSFAVVAREILADDRSRQHTVQRLADDVAIWDQRGCLSPQVCIVESDVDAARDFGAAVAGALAELAERLPPAQLTSAERLALRRFCDEAAWRGFGGERTAVLALDGDGAGTVVVEPTPLFRPTPLCRSLRVLPIADLAALGALLAPVRAWLECAGLAAPPQRWPVLARRLGESGVHRVCEVGEMQRPPLTWRQGGRPRLADWLVG